MLTGRVEIPLSKMVAPKYIIFSNYLSTLSIYESNVVFPIKSNLTVSSLSWVQWIQLDDSHSAEPSLTSHDTVE